MKPIIDKTQNAPRTDRIIISMLCSDKPAPPSIEKSSLTLRLKSLLSGCYFKFLARMSILLKPENV